jgi:hypothetical protein
VADLESESAHRYELGDARETDDQALAYAYHGRAVAEGARVARSFDRFVLRTRSIPEAVLVGRLWADIETQVEVRVGEATVGIVRLLPTGEWNEVTVDVPPAKAAAVVTLTTLDGAKFGSAHYWLYRAAPSARAPAEEAVP